MAILTIDDFDVDPISCELAGAYPVRLKMEDVDYDGETIYGDQITGTDSVNILPKGNMYSKKAKKNMNLTLITKQG